MSTTSRTEPASRSLRKLFPLLVACALVGSSVGLQAQNIYVSNAAGSPFGFVGEYNGTSGAAAAGFNDPNGINLPYSLAISDNMLYVTEEDGILQYNATTGASVNLNFITLANAPISLAASGNVLYAAVVVSNMVAAYNATTGAAIAGWTAPSGFSGIAGLAVSGNNLYVCDETLNVVNEYNATTGAPVAGWTSPSGLNTPNALAVSGNDLYVVNFSTGKVGEYNATTGAPIAGWTSPSGLNHPNGLAVVGNDLYVTNTSSNAVGEYNATTGAPVAGFTSPSGLDNPYSIVATPEPGSATLLVFGVGALFCKRRRLVQE